jgi:hypothetical protein
MALLRLCSFVLIAAVAACGGGDTGDDDVDENELTLETGEYLVPSGDSFECFYTDVITDRELAVLRATGDQGGNGGHHITVYYTDTVQEVGHHPCDDFEMTMWHQVGGAGESNNDPDFSLDLPAGLATRVPAGKQMVLQSHYINTGEPAMANDFITLHLGAPTEVEAYVNQFVVIDVGFQVPAGQGLESITTCTVPSEVAVVTLLGHMHEWGTYYKLEIIDDQDQTMDMLYETVWDPSYSSHPPVNHYTKEAPLVLAAGTRIRQTCQWQNTEFEDLLFPREMCLSYSLFFPDPGDEIFCENDE